MRLERLENTWKTRLSRDFEGEDPDAVEGETREEARARRAEAKEQLKREREGARKSLRRAEREQKRKGTRRKWLVWMLMVEAMMMILGRDRVAVKSAPAVVVRRRSGEKKGAENVGLALVPVAGESERDDQDQDSEDSRDMNREVREDRGGRRRRGARGRRNSGSGARQPGGGAVDGRGGESRPDASVALMQIQMGAHFLLSTFLRLLVTKTTAASLSSIDIYPIEIKT